MSERVAPSMLGALELGGSKALCAVGNAREIVAEARIVTSDPESTLSAVEAFFMQHRAHLSALGIASFGPLELDRSTSAYGSLLSTPKPGWSGASLFARLQRALSLPLAIDTDVNAAALAEQRLGAGQGSDPCLYVTVGTGLGVGVVSSGQLLHGLLHAELGHVAAPAWCEYEGCCPYHGRCLEGVAAAPAIALRTGAQAHELGDDHPVWQLEARYLGHLLAVCVLAHAPRRIVLGGGVLARAGLRAAVREQLVAQIAGYVPRRELTREGVDAYVVAPHFTQRAGLVGAFLLAEAALAG